MVNYCVKSIRNDVSMQEALEIPEPPTTLSWAAWRWNKAERTKLHKTNILRETRLQHLPAKYQQGRGVSTRSKHVEAALGRPGASSAGSGRAVPLQYMACTSISSAGKPWSHSGHDTRPAAVGLHSDTVLPASSSSPT